MQSVPNAKHYKLPAYQLSMHVTVAILSKIQTCQITKHQGASKPDSILSILHACQITKYVKSKHTAIKTCRRANISIAHEPKCKHTHLAYLQTCEMPINLPLCYALVCCAMLCCAMCPLVGAVDCTAIQPLPALPRQSCLPCCCCCPLSTCVAGHS